MANTQSTLPEGTDSIISDATMDETPAGSSYGDEPTFGDNAARDEQPAAAAKAKLGEAAAKVGDATAGLRAQAADKARDYASQGKDRAVGALENVTRLVDDAAGTIDDKIGQQYGDYARRASDYVASFADTLREKDVDELFDDAREAVRKSPAIAIGAAAAIGFVLARIIKAGVPAATTDTGEGRDRGGYAPGETGAAPKPTPSTATTVPTDSSL